MRLASQGVSMQHTELRNELRRINALIEEERVYLGRTWGLYPTDGGRHGPKWEESIARNVAYRDELMVSMRQLGIDPWVALQDQTSEMPKSPAGKAADAQRGRFSSTYRFRYPDDLDLEATKLAEIREYHERFERARAMYPPDGGGHGAKWRDGINVLLEQNPNKSGSSYYWMRKDDRS
jgi:hypothetical protein